MSADADKKYRFTEHEDTMGLLASSYAYALANGELLDIRHFIC